MDFIQVNEFRTFNRIYREIDDLYHEIALKLGISDSAFLIFYTIVECGGGCLQIDIANRYSISKQTISSAVRKLEAQGFIVLKKGHGRDRHICLTEDGTRFVNERMIPVMQAENSVFSEMTPEEVKELLDLSRKYEVILRKKFNELVSKLI